MMHLSKFFIATLCISFFFLACEKEVDWSADSDTPEKVVIESILTNEFVRQTVKLSYSKSSQQAPSKAISGAIVYVNDGTQDIAFIESDSIEGHYVSTIPFAASVSKIFELRVNIDHQSYFASTGMRPIAPMQALQYEPADADGYFRIKYVAPMYDPNEEAFYEILVVGDSIISSVDTAQSAKVFYYTFSTIDVGEVFAPDKDQVIFKQGAWLIERKYSLTPEFADFVRAIASETQWQGSFLSEKPANIPSNITGGAIGFFTACTVITDSIKVQ